MIYKLETFIDESLGIAINAKTPFPEPKVDPTKLTALPAIRYSAAVPIPTPQGMANFEFDFPDTFSLIDCFSKFKETFEEQFQKRIAEAKEAQRGQIIMPPTKEIIT